MKWALIGHRGVGKTNLLRRLEKYFLNSDCRFFDLDQEIEIQTKKTISEIFKSQGESYFRTVEAQTLKTLASQPSFVVSLGAGFDLEKNKDLLKGILVIWVRRETDKLGRIFVDRPRLDLNLSRLDEYDQRYRAREIQYLKYCDVIFEMPEGLESENDFEKQFFQGQKTLDGFLTVQDVQHIEKLSELFTFSELEFRTDLDGKNSYLQLKDKFSQCSKIMSFRNSEDVNSDPLFTRETSQKLRFDWALELGPPPPWFKPSLANIVSLHSLGDFKNYEGLFHLKYSPLISRFEELQKGFEWQQQDPDHRSFLPRSSDGSWMWFRQFMKDRQKINFLSSGLRSASDQPSIYKWISTIPQSKFAAVLGAPVIHSRSPLEHQKFFHEKNLNFFAISLSQKSFENDFKVLEGLGLVAAAVTSPLKKNALSTATSATPEALQYQSANTLAQLNDSWHCHNTDAEGFLKSLSFEDKTQNFLVWGGGGTLEMLRAALPQAIFLSASTGELRSFSLRLPPNFRQIKWTLVWAAGPSADPPEEFSLNKVIDLNYTEHSRARDIAAIQNVKYVSGLNFFKEQAQLQREYWSGTFKSTEKVK